MLHRTCQFLQQHERVSCLSEEHGGMGWVGARDGAPADRVVSVGNGDSRQVTCQITLYLEYSGVSQ